MHQQLAARVEEIHRRAFTVDGHFDLTYEVQNRRERGQRKIIETSYLEGFRQGRFDLLVSAMFIPDYFLPEMGLRRALDQISHLLEEIDESPGAFRLCRSTTEAQAARQAKETALFLSLEGAEPLQNDIQLLRIFHELGVRGLGLVWSRRNMVGDGAFFKPTRTGHRGGLSHFGVQLVERAEALGMVIDVSHLNDEGLADVLEIASRPLIASHSNCRALAGTMRNLTDRQIEAIAAGGGVIGINAVNHFLRDDGAMASVTDMADHLDHLVKIAGVAHAGLGLDLCDSFRDHLNLEQALPTRDVLVGHQALAELTALLLERGYSDEAILGILGGNFLRVFTEILG
jgi:membrane dipeptidase